MDELTQVERALPYAVPLYPGQSLESYVESLSVAYHVAPKTMISRLGLPASRTSNALLNLDYEDTERIASLCRLDPADVRAATIRQYEPVGLAPPPRNAKPRGYDHWTTFARDSGTG